jgi:hypothetical protein
MEAERLKAVRSFGQRRRRGIFVVMRGFQPSSVGAAYMGPRIMSHLRCSDFSSPVTTNISRLRRSGMNYRSIASHIQSIPGTVNLWESSGRAGGFPPILSGRILTQRRRGRREFKWGLRGRSPPMISGKASRPLSLCVSAPLRLCVKNGLHRYGQQCA